MNRQTNVNELLGSTDRDAPQTPPTTSRRFRNNLNTSLPTLSSSINIGNSALSDDLPFNMHMGDSTLPRSYPSNEADIERISAMSSTRRNNSASANANVFNSVYRSGTQAETPPVSGLTVRRPRPYPSSDAADDDEVVFDSSTLPPVTNLTQYSFKGAIKPRSVMQRIVLSGRVLRQTNSNPNPMLVGRRCAHFTIAAEAANKNNDLGFVADNKPSRHDNNKEDSTEKPAHICSICLQSYLQEKPTTTKCGHVFCEGCIKRAIRFTRKCPLCNLKITPRNLFRLHL